MFATMNAKIKPTIKATTKLVFFLMKKSGSLGEREKERRRRCRREGGVKKAENLIKKKEDLSIIVFPLKLEQNLQKVPFFPKMQIEKESKMRNQ